ncbi:MAG: hypothetical protein KGS61_18970 [Verrucomicrobia bacterium]|nr:hypothetical protein [Verrucomicrobiota bacterium]
MKRYVLFGTLALVASSLIAADSDSKDEVTSAAKKLADQSSYSWKQTMENASGQGFRGSTEGKLEKDGYTLLTMSRGDNSIQAVLKGSQGAIKTEDGWQSLEEAASNQQGPGRFLGRMLRNFKAPAVQAQDLATKAKELKKDGEAYASDLTEEGAKSLLTFGGRRGGNGPEISGAKGSVKFWVKDGVLSKYQTHVQGTVSFNGNDRDVDRTTTIEIQEVGTTKVEVPDEAKKKLS